VGSAVVILIVIFLLTIIAADQIKITIKIKNGMGLQICGQIIDATRTGLVFDGGKYEGTP
jgi:hypothetical protein